MKSAILNCPATTARPVRGGDSATLANGFNNGFIEKTTSALQGRCTKVLTLGGYRHMANYPKCLLSEICGKVYHASGKTPPCAEAAEANKPSHNSASTPCIHRYELHQTLDFKFIKCLDCGVEQRII